MKTPKQTTVVNTTNTDKSVDVRIGHVNVVDGKGKHILNTPPTELGWLGNPHELTDGLSIAERLQQYREDFTTKLSSDEAFREAVANLSGKTIGTSLPPHRAHGPIIAKHADRLASKDTYENKTVYGYGPNEGNDMEITSDGEVNHV